MKYKLYFILFILYSCAGTNNEVQVELKSLSISNCIIGFSSKINNYSCSVPAGTNAVKVKALASLSVYINDEPSYEKDIFLLEDTTIVKVKVESYIRSIINVYLVEINKEAIGLKSLKISETTNSSNLIDFNTNDTDYSIVGTFTSLYIKAEHNCSNCIEEDTLIEVLLNDELIDQTYSILEANITLSSSSNNITIKTKETTYTIIVVGASSFIKKLRISSDGNSNDYINPPSSIDYNIQANKDAFLEILEVQNLNRVKVYNTNNTVFYEGEYNTNLISLAKPNTSNNFYYYIKVWHTSDVSTYYIYNLKFNLVQAGLLSDLKISIINSSNIDLVYILNSFDSGTVYYNNLNHSFNTNHKKFKFIITHDDTKVDNIKFKLNGTYLDSSIIDINNIAVESGITIAYIINKRYHLLNNTFEVVLLKNNIIAGTYTFNIKSNINLIYTSFNLKNSNGAIIASLGNNCALDDTDGLSPDLLEITCSITNSSYSINIDSNTKDSILRSVFKELPLPSVPFNDSISKAVTSHNIGQTKEFSFRNSIDSNKLLDYNISITRSNSGAPPIE